MSVYNKFEKSDILQSIVHASPRIILASGSGGASGSIVGWRGNTGPSASLSLYEGIRGRGDVKSGDFAISGLSIIPLDELDTHSIDKVIFVSGSYPSTGSVRMVKVRNSEAPNRLTDVTDVDWYDEHFSPINLLFDFYSRYREQYFTGSYDYYCLHFAQDASNAARATISYGDDSNITDSLTHEVWIKPLQVTGSHDFVLQHFQNRFKFYITGSNGKLAWTDYDVVLTSSMAVTKAIWQNVAASLSSGTMVFYVNGEEAGTAAYTGTLPPFVGNGLIIGSEASGTIFVDAVYNNGFNGFMFESRAWSVARTSDEISGNFSKTLTGPVTSSYTYGLSHYFRFNDGPFGHGWSNDPYFASYLINGSGAFDYSTRAQHGQLTNFIPAQLRPNWMPNDNPDFVPLKTRINDRVDMFRTLHIPSMFYGNQIATGSVKLVCNTYNSLGIVRELNDDGRGGLYLSGSFCRPLSGESYRGIRWNKVGNVFYSEGLVVITDPSLLDFGDSAVKNWSGTPDILQVSFDGRSRIFTNVFMCRMGPAQLNASNNPTFSAVGDLDLDGNFIISDGDSTNDRSIVKQEEEITTWVTAIGLYNEERKLIAVAKLAQPIRKREKDKIDIRLKFDF